MILRCIHVDRRTVIGAGYRLSEAIDGGVLRADHIERERTCASMVTRLGSQVGRSQGAAAARYGRGMQGCFCLGLVDSWSVGGCAGGGLLTMEPLLPWGMWSAIGDGGVRLNRADSDAGTGSKPGHGGRR